MNLNKARTPLKEHPWRNGYTVPSDSDGYTEAARRKKAEKLADLFGSEGYRSEEVALCTEGHWKAACRIARVKALTEQERTLVVSVLRKREGKK